MLFNSVQFALFFIILYIFYRLAGHKLQNGLLLAASYLFYAAWDWRFLSLILFSTAVNYTCAVGIYAYQSAAVKKKILTVCLVTNLGLLFFFKYANFFIESMSYLLSAIGLPADIRSLGIILPIGISFYTFQTMGYAIDVYRGQIEPERHFPTFALFIAFFPQLVAGPIERAKNLLPQIKNTRQITADKLSAGSFLVLYGLFQKLVVADNLAIIADRGVFAGHMPGNGWQILLAVYAFAFQIFCDFAGYSNIARGIAAYLGFNLMVNFDAPYFTTNPRAFWRKWHISLSTWLRDYLYIPLGGGNRNTMTTVRNLAITMLLGGLWHGAAWTFVVWGAYHGMLLAIHRLSTLGLAPNRHPSGRMIFAGWGILKGVVFFQMICIGWVFFRSESIEIAGLVLKTLAFCRQFVFDGALSADLLKIAFILPPLIVVEISQHVTGNSLSVLKWPLPFRVFLYVLLFYEIVILGVNNAQSFVYFQF